MKKLVILFAAILPFLFFSCASDSGIPEDSAKNETELTENLEESSVQDSEPLDNNQNQTEKDDVSGIDENAEISNNDESSDNNTQTELEPVEIITEPEIITLEPEEETETKNDDKTTETTENEDVELVIDSDLILPDADVDFTNKTDESENSQKSDKGAENSENEGLSDISADNENQNTEESSQSTNENISTENNDENVTTNEELDFTGNDSDNSENSDDLDNSDDSDENEKTEETEEAEEETIEEIVPVPSRTVSLKRGETLIVIYPGSGWIYLGSTSEYNNLTSKGRKLGSTDTTYTLLAKEPGTQLHHFYKTDNLTGNYIDDYLEVTVLDAKGKSSTKITAPSYAEVIPPRPEQIQKNQESAVHSDENSGNLQNKSDSQVQESTSVQNDSEKLKDESLPNTDSKQNESSYNYDSDDDIEFLEDVDEEEEYEEKSAPVENTDELLEQAKSLYNEKKYTEANTCLSVFFEYASTRRDEALYLQGQIYESESSVKDIKKAVETYKNLIQNYPASPYWDKANKRIIYLNRFYFEAR